MSSVPGKPLFGRKRSLAGSPWADHCHHEDPAGQGGRLLAYLCASGEFTGQPPVDPNKRALHQARPHPSSKTM